MRAKVGHGDCVVSEYLLLNRGVVILDSRRFQIRNSSENVIRRCARGIGTIGLERHVRVCASRLRPDANPVKSSGVRRRVITGVRPKGFEESRETRLTCSCDGVDRARTAVPRRGDREHAQVGVCKRPCSSTLESIGRADSRKICYVVSHSVTNSERGLTIAKDVPSQSGARAKVSKVQIIEAREPLLQPYQAVWKPSRRADCWFRRSAGEEIGAIFVGVTQSPIDVPAQAVTDCHARGHFPFVLEKQSYRGLVEVA